jgi:replicative DNA helicase
MSGQVLDAQPGRRAPMAAAAEHALPFSTDAEKAVLGAMILDASQIEVVMALVKPEFFYHQRHKQLSLAIIELYEKGQSVDFTTLTTEMRRRGQLEEVGGPGYIVGLEQYVFSTANAKDHAHIVLQKHQLRELINIAEVIKDQAITEANDVDVLLGQAEAMIFELGERRPTKDFQDIGTLTLETIEEIDRRSRSTHDVTGVATGYTDLDEWTGGFQSSDLIILAARPSVGKTAFALNMVCNIGAGMRERRMLPEVRRPVGIFSLEMSASQINMRLLSTISNVPMHKMRSGRLTQTEMRRIHENADTLHDAPIFVDDTPGISVLELRAKARRMYARRPDLSLIIIDYLQLMRGSGLRGSDNRQQEVAEISRSLKALARELNVPIIALSQLSRLIEQRKGKGARPMLSDLRESGAIEQDADVVMFLHREKHFDKKDGDDEEQRAADITAEPAELIIGKQRNGPIGTIDLVFFRQTATYHNLHHQQTDGDGPGY